MELPYSRKGERLPSSERERAGSRRSSGTERGRTRKLGLSRSSLTVLNRPICLHEKDNVSDLESSRLAGLKQFIWSNLCTRHIPNKLTPRGHEDWPDKRRSIYRGNSSDASSATLPLANSGGADRLPR